MGLLRSLLLRGSRNAWLRERAVRYPVVRRSVSRFMPGEDLGDALAAAVALKGAGIAAILAHLGENVADAGEAERVTDHYQEALDAVRNAGLDAQISVKLTQLGLDVDGDACLQNLRRLVRHAEKTSNFVWIDMEASPYVDVTLAQYRAARAEAGNVGVCLQSYLKRTRDDLESLLPLKPALRLVKGAYREPAEVAFPRKADVDASYRELAERFFDAAAARGGGVLGVATHDLRLVRLLKESAARRDLAKQRYEFEMLYGIQQPLQRELAAQGHPVRVLISYGRYWFPWYMRRLAERPANVLFVLKNALKR
jgi:proline dehydrogenase